MVLVSFTICSLDVRRKLLVFEFEMITHKHFPAQKIDESPRKIQETMKTIKTYSFVFTSFMDDI